MEHGKQTLPTPSKTAVAKWLRQLNRQKLHDEGWGQANKRFHNITLIARPFIQQQFQTPEEQEAAFDGLALALLTISHFQDIEKLAPLFASQKNTQLDERPPKRPASNQSSPDKKRGL